MPLVLKKRERKKEYYIFNMITFFKDNFPHIYGLEIITKLVDILKKKE